MGPGGACRSDGRLLLGAEWPVPSTPWPGSSEPLEAGLYFDIRHALDGIRERDILHFLTVEKELQPLTHSVCFAVCLLLQYTRPPLTPSGEECYYTLQAKMQSDVRLLHDIIAYDVRKVNRKAFEMILKKFHDDASSVSARPRVPERYQRELKINMVEILKKKTLIVCKDFGHN